MDEETETMEQFRKRLHEEALNELGVFTSFFLWATNNHYEIVQEWHELDRQMRGLEE